jgi:CrcB protein
MQESYLGQVALVGAGGFLGSVARFVLGGLVHRLLPATTLQVGTLVVNVTGCLLIGILGGLAELRQALSPAYRVFLMIGVLGGFTTFSTFSYETLQLAQHGDLVKAALNVALQVVLGLAAAWIGFVLVRYL